MTDQLALDLVEKQLVTDQLVLTVGYDTSNLTDPDRRMRYAGPVRIDHYGRPVPKEAHGSINLDWHTSSGRIITDAMMKLFDRCVNPNLLVRRITVAAAHVLNEKDVPATPEEQPVFSRITRLWKNRERPSRRNWTRRSDCNRRFSTSKSVWGRIPSSRA